MRVMTWNLWWRFGDWQARRKAIRTVLAREEPDICGLQEVWADNDENLAEWLADELGMHWAWGPTNQPQRWRERVGDPAVHFGVAMLSRWPITDPQVFELPEEPSRTALSAVVAAPHARVPFFTTHLTALPGHSARRIRQVEWLARHVADRAVADHPPVVTGDLNALPESDEVRLLAGDLTVPVVEGQVLLDAWRFAPPGEPGFTWDRRNPYVEVRPEPSGRIDYIHVGLRWSGPGFIQSARLAGASAVDGVWPSDHAAVIAELSED